MNMFFEAAKWICISLISLCRVGYAEGGEDGFRDFLWVNKLIDGLIDGRNKSPIISLTKERA